MEKSFAACDETFAKPSKPLDPRIDPEKLTQQDPPALPQELILPMPANFRIAKLASEVPISAEHWRKANQAIERGLKYLGDIQDDSHHSGVGAHRRVHLIHRYGG